MSDDVNRPNSFALHIQPLFRQVGVDSRHFMFDLTKYEDVVANSRDILSCLKRVDRSLQSLDRRRTSSVDTPWG